MSKHKKNFKEMMVESNKIVHSVRDLAKNTTYLK
ncbi:hypothetical protein IGI43_001868 [Enterococcus sp. AZ126]